jgi:branched-chain amino acid transport system substrate-binding protein
MSMRALTRRRDRGLLVLVAVIAMAAAACSSSKKSSSSSTAAPNTTAAATGAAGAAGAATTVPCQPTASAPGVTADAYTVGVVAEETGVAAFNDKGFAAFKARIDAQNDAGGVYGRKINLVMEDSQSSPTQNLTDVQKIVLTSNPFVMVDNSAFLSSAYRYLVTQKIPTVTGGFDGPEYADAGNEYLLPMLVGNIGKPYPPINTIVPSFFKEQGVTKGAGLGYSISPSSSAAAANFVTALTVLGLPGGYVNTSIPFGGENVGSVILDMKRHGVDGAYLAMDNNTNFAVANAAIQNGLTFKALVMATGYDQSLLSNPTTLATAEHGNVFLASNFIPYEAATPGVTRMQNIFQKYLGIAPTTHPVFGYWVMYADAQLLIDGLKAAGCNPTRQGFVDAVRSFDNWNDDGIMCAGVSFTQATYGTIITRPGCTYIIKVQNGQFQVVEKVTGHNIASGSQASATSTTG